MINNDTVIISLTSYSIRLRNVGKTTIWSLINNQFKNKHIVLTVYKGDLELIPPDIRLMSDKGVIELMIVDEDLAPHKKYFYTMKKYRNNPIITVDDDAIYPKDMIEKMYIAYKHNPNTIIARRSFIISGRNGELDSYKIWMKHFAGITKPSFAVMPTGLGGILYPPDCLGISDANLPEIYDVKYDDDFYLKALEIRKGLKVMNICKTWDELFIKNLDDPYTQSIALWNRNKNGESDKLITKYKKEFLYALQ